MVATEIASSSRNTARHEPPSCSACEPTTGPASGAAVIATVNSVVPRRLSARSRAWSAIAAYESETQIAAAAPCTTRQAMNSAIDEVAAQPAVASVKATSAKRIAWPRPIRRASSPIANWVAPSETTKALSVSCSWLGVAPSASRNTSSAGR